jgi:hypothetical protein
MGYSVVMFCCYLWIGVLLVSCSVAVFINTFFTRTVYVFHSE